MQSLCTSRTEFCDKFVCFASVGGGGEGDRVGVNWTLYYPNIEKSIFVHSAVLLLEVGCGGGGL